MIKSNGLTANKQLPKIVHHVLLLLNSPIPKLSKAIPTHKRAVSDTSRWHFTFWASSFQDLSHTSVNSGAPPPTHSLHLLDCGAVRRVKEFLLIAFDWQSALSSFARSLEWGKPCMHWSMYRLMAGIWTALMDGDTGRPALRGADVSETHKVNNCVRDAKLCERSAKSITTCLHCKGGQDSPQDKQTADLCKTYIVRIWVWCSRDRR